MCFLDRERVVRKTYFRFRHSDIQTHANHIFKVYLTDEMILDMNKIIIVNTFILEITFIIHHYYSEQI